MADPPSVSTQQAMANPGDSATLRAAGDADIKPPDPDPDRKAKPDATGYYEGEPPTPGNNAQRLLHLNQAGCALVGWLTLPPGRFVLDPGPDPDTYVSVAYFPVGPAVLAKRPRQRRRLPNTEHR